MVRYRLAESEAVDTDVDSIAMLRSGTIIMAVLSLAMDSVANDARCAMYLSLDNKAPVTVGQVEEQNTQVLGQLVVNHNLVGTAGLSGSHANLVLPLAIKVEFGQFVYVHYKVVSATDCNGEVILYVR